MKEFIVSREELLSNIETLEDPRNKGLIATCYLTTARAGEIIRLCPPDILNSGDFIIFRVYTEKNRKHPLRRVPVPKQEYFLKFLWEWMELRSKVCSSLPDSLPVFYSYGKFGNRSRSPVNGLCTNMVWKIVKKASPKLYVHLLRHSRLTEVAPNMQPIELKSMAGWTTVAPLDTYLHLMPTIYAKKIEAWRPKK